MAFATAAVATMGANWYGWLRFLISEAHRDFRRCEDPPVTLVLAYEVQGDRPRCTASRLVRPHDRLTLSKAVVETMFDNVGWRLPWPD